MVSRMINRAVTIALTLAFFITVPLIASATVRGHLVDVPFVMDKTGNAGWVILDARSPADYRRGHIPGAVNLGIATGLEKVSWDIYRDPTARWLPVNELEALLGKVGITYDKGVVVYGRKGDYHSGLIMMIFDYLDHKKAYFLDGGWEKWVATGGLVETRINKPAQAQFEARKVHEDMYVTTEEMVDYVQSPGTVTIVDVRSVGEWEGTKMFSVRGGRIPGAVHLPVYDLINEDGTLVSTQKMAALYSDIPKDKPIVTYCQRGCRASFAYMTAKSLGYDVKYYDDGWRVWGMKEHLPAENEQWIHIKKIFVLEKQMEAVVEELQNLRLELEQLEVRAAPTAAAIRE